jgi:hypothetical protein
LFWDELFYALLLLDFIVGEETLMTVLTSVTRNIRSILMTTLFAVILVYYFSIFGFLFLKDDFIISHFMVEDEVPQLSMNEVTIDTSSNACTKNITEGKA